MDLLVARTGLTLNPGQMADLVLAWRQVAGLIAAIPRSTALLDDQAYVFKLPGPAAAPPQHKPAAKAKKPAPKPPSKAKKSAARTTAKPARKR